MGKLGFALGTLAGMAINMANARERKAFELNERGVLIAERGDPNTALKYFYEAERLMPTNRELKRTIETNIRICKKECEQYNEKVRIPSRNNVNPELNNELKRCPICNLAVNKKAEKCHRCGHKFYFISNLSSKNSKNYSKLPNTNLKRCPQCNLAVHINAKKCFRCGHRF